MNARLVALLTTVLAILGALTAAPADARGRGGDVTKVFQDVYVDHGETIEGDVNVVFGDAHIAGTVTGDCNTVFGQCTVADGGQVMGKINGVSGDGVRPFVPWVVNRDRSFGAFAEQDHRLFVKLLSSAVVILVFLLFPLRMRVAVDRIEKHPALSAAVGAVAAVAVVPIAFMLIISIIGIPLVLLEVAAIIAGVWIGTGAIALVVGRRLCELVMPHATPSPLVALILGLVVVAAAEIVPVVGWVVTALVWLAGLGAAILSFIRSTNVDAPGAYRARIGGGY